MTDTQIDGTIHNSMLPVGRKVHFRIGIVSIYFLFLFLNPLSGFSQIPLITSDLSNGDNKRIKWSNYVAANIVYCFLETDKDIWVGTHGSGLIRIDKNSRAKEYFNTTNSIVSSDIESIVKGANDYIWIITSNKLVSFDGTKWKMYPQTNALKSKCQIQAATDGTIWIGSKDGVAHLVHGVWNIVDFPTVKFKLSTFFLDSKDRVRLSGGETIYCFDSLRVEKV